MDLSNESDLVLIVVVNKIQNLSNGFTREGRL